MAEYVYYANATLDDGSEVILDLEEHGWADKELLSRTKHWALTPKPGAMTLAGHPYPFVSVQIPDGAKPIFRSRVYRSSIMSRSSDQIARKVVPVMLHPEFRAYCIGWKKGSTIVWTWVLPNGSIETGTDDDSRLGDLLRRHLNTVVMEVPEAVDDTGSTAE